jgi:hypothetical protein
MPTVDEVAMRVSEALVKKHAELAKVDMENCRDTARRMLVDDSKPDEFLDFWNLVDIKAESILEKIDTLLSLLEKGEF